MSLELAFHQSLNGAPTTLARGTAEAAWERKVIRILVESGSFARVAPDLEAPDLILKMRVEDEGHGSGLMAFITGLSLYLVPSFATDKFVLDATVSSAATKRSWKFHLEDFVTQWQHAILIPVMPFRLTPVVTMGVQENLIRNLVAEMHREQVFDELEAGTPSDQP